MNELTRRLLSEIDIHRAALYEAVQAVPEGLRERRPSTDRWSVAEILEHLAITEQRIARLVLDGAADLQPGEPPAVAELPALTMARLLDRTERVEAPERVRPEGTVDAATAWQQLEASRAALRGAVEKV
ncbi:MAG: DinB-like domain protein [Acidobacteria bacterium]|nr:DinB-like domain protein [Acidobacteriota bacterium]